RRTYHQRSLSELARSEAPPAAGGIRWEHELKLLLAERPGDQLLTRERQVRGAELASALADQRRDLICTLWVEHPGLNARIASAEASNQIRHGVPRERRQRANLDRARPQFEHAADGRARLVDRPHDLAGRSD